MLLNVLAFVCLAKAQRDEQYPIDDDSDQRNAMEESDIARRFASSPSKKDPPGKLDQNSHLFQMAGRGGKSH